jgi:3-phosphoshikimate 1-carboxyvinyltransferase
MAEFRVRKAPSIQAELSVPGDKSISHRSVMLAALGRRKCFIEGFLPSEDCLATVDCFRKLGVQIETLSELGEPWQEGERVDQGQTEHGPTRLLVHGRGPKLQAPTEELYCGNSGTTMRLISGILAAQPFTTTLTGDPSLSGRTMKRIMLPLNAMGAKISSIAGNDKAPLRIEGGDLTPIRYELPVASAQVKSAILLAGMLSEGTTTVVEPQATRDHTETMLRHFGVQTVRQGKEVSIAGGQIPDAMKFSVPGDISSAAFWLVAAAAQTGAKLTVKNVGLNPTRTGIIKVLVRMGAQINEVCTGS